MYADGRPMGIQRVYCGGPSMFYSCLGNQTKGVQYSQHVLAKPFVTVRAPSSNTVRFQTPMEGQLGLNINIQAVLILGDGVCFTY